MLRRVESTDDIEELREELKHTGYLRSTDKRRSKKSGQTEQRPPQEFRTSVALQSSAGETTCKMTDLHLNMHIRTTYGSMSRRYRFPCNFTYRGQGTDDRLIPKAAMIAAVYSQAHGGQNVPGLQRVRYVKSHRALSQV